MRLHRSQTMLAAIVPATTAQAAACAVVAGTIAANMVCDRWSLMPGLYRRDLDLPPRPR